jgi:hypothetical protein
MNNAQEYRIPPLKRVAKIYQFPSRVEETMSFEQRQALRDEQVMRQLREKARLEANAPAPWYKRLAKWYDQNYESLFEGTGAAILSVCIIFGTLLIYGVWGR